ncbi:hypothetical protein ROTAS13_00195 [Roseomonas sp. TAS13]|uniref:Uncharacterized protein n=1 Tax=Roseomonas mucosa TaxID=207340 RepID=A0A379PME8_9PROT|nr:hypothetical protein ROTAS13_00195 [Roseomonas sp. TAS13]SUE95442.1 Uncharacterised protein [Roseomonas mucosa]
MSGKRPVVRPQLDLFVPFLDRGAWIGGGKGLR